MPRSGSKHAKRSSKDRRTAKSSSLQIQDVTYQLEGRSKLSILLDEAEQLLALLTPNLTRIQNMKANFQMLVNSNLYEQSEIDEFQKSIEFHISMIGSQTDSLKEKLIELDSLFQKKKDMMAQMFDLQTLDNGVVENWLQNMKKLEARMEKIHSTLAFMSE